MNERGEDSIAAWPKVGLAAFEKRLRAFAHLGRVVHPSGEFEAMLHRRPLQVEESRERQRLALTP